MVQGADQCQFRSLRAAKARAIGPRAVGRGMVRRLRRRCSTRWMRGRKSGLRRIMREQAAESEIVEACLGSARWPCKRAAKRSSRQRLERPRPQEWYSASQRHDFWAKMQQVKESARQLVRSASSCGCSSHMLSFCASALKSEPCTTGGIYIHTRCNLINIQFVLFDASQTIL